MYSIRPTCWKLRIYRREDLTVEVPPIALEDTKVEERRRKTVNLVKVIWDRRTGDSTWELEEDMRKSHPHLFTW